jgi:hypothetical protein
VTRGRHDCKSSQKTRPIVAEVPIPPTCLAGTTIFQHTDRVSLPERLRRLDARVLPKRATADPIQRGKGMVLAGGTMLLVAIPVTLLTGRWTFFVIGAGFTLIGAVYLRPSHRDARRRTSDR